MDINQQSEQFIQFLTNHFISNLTAQVNHRVLENISLEVNKANIAREIDKQISATVANAIQAYTGPQATGLAGVGEQLLVDFKTRSDTYLTQLAQDVKQRAQTDFAQLISSTDLMAVIREQVEQYLKHSLATNTWTFLPNSIPAASIQSADLKVKAENIEPGTIAKFSSSGIEDLSSDCQITITDQFTIMENKLVTQDLEIRGQVNIDPNQNQRFTDMLAQRAVDKIQATYNDGTYDQYVQRVLNQIAETGIDASDVLVQGKPIVESNALNPSITMSNLRKMGLLVELEVDGETLLDNTLYVRSGKVGINTNEPQYTLEFWDQEVQVIATKRERDAAFLGTVKPQSLVIGTNTRDQLVLLPNGDIQVESINIGKTKHSSAAWQPTDNRQLGTIVWNEQPQIGQPIGWVSLGGARWARFGIITE
jgi:hypothetical protein